MTVLMPAGGLGLNVLTLDEATSTNDIAKGLARDGAPHGMTVLARAQSGGRGRRGRQWQSAPGMGLYMSVILTRVPAPGLVTLAGALAGLGAVEALVPGIEGLGLKWPNDLVAGREERKLGGVLAETTPGGTIVLGIGINLCQGQEDFQPELRGLATSLLAETGAGIEAEGLARQVLMELGQLLVAPPEEVVTKARERCMTLGRRVRVVAEGGCGHTGLAMGLDAMGRLVLLKDDDSEELALSAGDISNLRSEHNDADHHPEG